jgi:YidC/Oxa1 family membrane protein insertase
MQQLGQEDTGGTSRLIWATLLMFAVLVAWGYFYNPAKKPAAKKEAQKQTAVQKKEGAAEKALPSKAMAAPVLAEKQLKAISGEKAQTFQLANQDLLLEVDSRGGVLVHAFLKKYHHNHDIRDDLVSPLAKAMGVYPLRIRTGDPAFNKTVNEALFHVEQRSEKDGTEVLTLKWSDGKGDAVAKVLSLGPKGYLVGFDLSAVKDGKPLPSVPVVWGPGLGMLTKNQAKNRYALKDYVALSKSGGFDQIERKKVSEKKPIVTESYAKESAVHWAALSSNYFAAIFMPKEPITHGIQVESIYLNKDLQKLHPEESDVQLVVSYPGSGKLYLGPKEYFKFRKMGDHFPRLMGWGGSFLGPILTPISGVLLWSLQKLNNFCHNWGIAILLLTLIIKLAFYPLTQRSMVKMKEMGENMKRLKPQIDRIKAKYKKMGKDMATRNKMNEEVMALYKREGVNPLGGMGGCLPMLIQMPIFFALFEFLPRSIELRGAYFFGWIKDLSLPDPYYITPILMGVAMVISTRMSMTQTVEGAQKLMMWFMPAFFTMICLNAPAGLTLYWLANTVLQMGQQYMINKQVAERQRAAQKARKSTPKRPSKPSHA